MSMLPLYILEILRKRTDEQHTLNQKDIIDRLRIDYGLEIERKAVRTNMERLVEMGYPIQFTETEREGNTIWSNFWYRSEFSDAELRLMIDSLLFSNHIPHASRQKLVKKIEGLTSEHFKSYVKHIATLPDTGESNKQIFYNIAFLDEAISKKQKVAFQYLDMDIDKKLHPKLNDEGEPKVYVVSPYQMAARDGKYYLICNHDGYDEISNYRIDRISEAEVLKDKIRPFTELPEACGYDFVLGKYMKEHRNMYASDHVVVRFKIVRRLIADIVDVFGKDVVFEQDLGDYVIVRATVTELAMIHFAKFLSPDVVILEPQRMVDEMKSWAKQVKKVYG